MNMAARGMDQGLRNKGQFTSGGGSHLQEGVLPGPEKAGQEKVYGFKQKVPAMIKHAARKKKNFQLGGAMPHPRGVNENKVNAFSSYYIRWRRSRQLCREAERQEIKTASDMWACMRYKIAPRRKSVRLALW